MDNKAKNKKNKKINRYLFSNFFYIYRCNLCMVYRYENC